MSGTGKGRWVLLYSKFTNWEWYSDIPTKVLFIHLLLTANWQETVWKGVKLERGQRIFTYRNLASECQLTVQQVKTALKHLQSSHTITLTSTPKFCIATLNNYDEYQPNNTLDNTEISHKATQKQHAETLADNTGYNNTEYINSININSYTSVSDIETPSEPQSDCPFSEIKILFNETCKSFPKIRSIDGQRKKTVAARWRTNPDIAVFKNLFIIAESSDFLKGKNDRSWCADFDWMMKSTNFDKILEHRYDNKPGKPSETSNAPDESNTSLYSL
ncbi:MAG: hypothetical protein ACI4J7_05610 [Ruminiclostridium sp.]